MLRTVLKILPDEVMIKRQYWYHFGRKLDLSEPRSFNEKLQWIKLYDRKPEYTSYVDKYAVRKHIAKTIGEEYLIPLLGVYDRVEDIDWGALPNQFVLKCTHGSGFNIICADKTKLDIEASKRKLRKWMKQNLFWYGREWAYKNVKPRIVCEKFMVDESGKELKDYKIFCFGGEPKLIEVDYNRFINHKQSLYDTQWNYIHASMHYHSDPKIQIRKPEKLEEMLKLARILAKEFYQLRVDLYYVNGRIYFGEMTLYDTSGYARFQPEEFGELLGSWIQL
jgi:hypothetical protein